MHIKCSVQGQHRNRRDLTFCSDFHGHVFSIVTMDFPPFIDYSRLESGPGGIVEPKDSMDVRILKEAARVFNFSFVMKEPEDGQWG